MNCTKIQSLSVDYQSAKLDKDLMQEIDLHISNCNDCKAFYNFSEKILEEISIDKIDTPIPFFYDEIIAKINEEKKAPSITHYLKISAAAAAIFIAMIGGNYLGNYSSITIDNNFTEQNADDIINIDLADNNFDLFNNI
ncbi:MAG: hypothetical protein B6I18_00780 [Bacteroidetes bacterium 4572_112]|nr:MAG: hypothetical protein B6I18_00780 [Bacteroidetes bacterium 4572_112]